MSVIIPPTCRRIQRQILLLWHDWQNTTAKNRRHLRVKTELTERLLTSAAKGKRDRNRLLAVVLE